MEGQVCDRLDKSYGDMVMTKYVVPALRFRSSYMGLGWVMRYKKNGPVEGSNSLDAELGGCATLIESLKIWLRKCGKSS